MDDVDKELEYGDWVGIFGGWCGGSDGSLWGGNRAPRGAGVGVIGHGFWKGDD